MAADACVFPLLHAQARFLRARNPHNPEIYGNTVSEEYERFLDDCDLPEQVPARMPDASTTWCQSTCLEGYQTDLVSFLGGSSGGMAGASALG